MWTFLTVLGCLSVAWQIFAQAMFTKFGSRKGAATGLYGPVFPPGTTLGVKVHEWTHFVTLMPYISVATKAFGWMLFWNYGWLAAVGIAWVAHWAIRYVGETIADITAMIAVGPKEFLGEIEEAHAKFGAGWVNLINYPPWRFGAFFRGRAKFEKMIDEELLKAGCTEKELKSPLHRALIKKFML